MLFYIYFYYIILSLFYKGNSDKKKTLESEIIKINSLGKKIEDKDIKDSEIIKNNQKNLNDEVNKNNEDKDKDKKNEEKLFFLRIKEKLKSKLFININQFIKDENVDKKENQDNKENKENNEQSIL